MTTDKAVELVADIPMKDISFSYSVTWLETEKTVKDRLVFEAQNRGQFVPKSLEVHWLSVINSTVLVLLLIGFVFIILVCYTFNYCIEDFANFNFNDPPLGIGMPLVEFAKSELSLQQNGEAFE